MRKLCSIVMALMLIFVVTACGNGNDVANDNQNDVADEAVVEGEGEENFRIAFMTNTLNNTFQIAMHDTYSRLAEEHGFEYVVFDPDYDLNTQLNQMGDVASQDFDVVFVIPVDSAGIRQGLETFQERGIPAFNVDTAVIEEDRDLVISIVATDAYMAGRLLGEQLVEDFPDGAQIAILDFPENESCVFRVKGFMSGIGDNIDRFEIVAQQNGRAALDVSLGLAEDIIQAHPGVQAFFAINDPSALGVVAAMQAQNRNDIKVYSIDASPDGKEALLEGHFRGLAAQVPIQIAEQSFFKALEFLRGNDIDEEILLPSFLVTLEMAEETLTEWQ